MTFDEPPQRDDVSTDIRSFPEPPVHGGAAAFVTSENLYDILQNQLVTNANDAVVTESFSPDFLPGDEYCILLTTSNWRAGIEENGHYRPYQEFSFKIRGKTEAGEPKRKTPRIALNVTVAPQDPDAVTKNGNDFTCPFGPGSLITVQTTNVGTAEEFVDRAAALFDAVVGHDLDRSHVKPASKRVTDIELTHRFQKEKLGPVVDTLRDTEDLITHANGAIEAYRSHDGRGWLEAKFKSERFERLGFPIERGIWLKAYSPRNPSANSVIRHPRIEARLGDGETFHFDDFDDVVHRLSGIICSHLLWAGVHSEDIVTRDDPLYQPTQPTLEWAHPVNRHEQLRERFASVATAVQKEALKSNTMALYDILQTLVEYPGSTYQDLIDRVGLGYSSIVRHVSRLVDKDILAKDTGAVTVVTYASQEVRERARQALKRIYPNEDADDRAERRQARRARRNEESSTDSEDVEGFDQRVATPRTELAEHPPVGHLDAEGIRSEATTTDPPPDPPPDPK